MSFVCGNAESARKLNEVFSMTMDKIESDLEELKRYKKNAISGWKDSGAQELDEICSEIERALNEATESRRNISNALEAYAEFLEKR